MSPLPLSRRLGYRCRLLLLTFPWVLGFLHPHTSTVNTLLIKLSPQPTPKFLAMTLFNHNKYLICFIYLLSFWIFETSSHYITLAGLKFTVLMRRALSWIQTSCFCLRVPRIIGMCHYAQPILGHQFIRSFVYSNRQQT